MGDAPGEGKPDDHDVDMEGEDSPEEQRKFEDALAAAKAARGEKVMTDIRHAKDVTAEIEKLNTDTLELNNITSNYNSVSVTMEQLRGAAGDRLLDLRRGLDRICADLGVKEPKTLKQKLIKIGAAALGVITAASSILSILAINYPDLFQQESAFVVMDDPDPTAATMANVIAGLKQFHTKSEDDFWNSYQSCLAAQEHGVSVQEQILYINALQHTSTLNPVLNPAYSWKASDKLKLVDQCTDIYTKQGAEPMYTLIQSHKLPRFISLDVAAISLTAFVQNQQAGK